jgi:ABC-type branched-subunit amino acid transport system substrate-binding protein
MQKVKTTLLWRCATVLALALGLPGGLAGGDDIVLGISAAFRGPSRALAIELYRGSMAYIDYVNATGGIRGRKIVVKALDDGYDPLPALTNTIELIDRHQAFLLFDYVGTPTVTRILPLLKLNRDRNILLFFPFTGGDSLRLPPYAPYVFNLRASYRQETAGLVDNFVRIGRKRIAVFYQADAFGRSGWDGVRKALAKHGLKIVAEATYRRGANEGQSFKPQVEILKKADPDAIISVGVYAAAAGFIRDARDAGWDGPIANISFVGRAFMLDILDANGRRTGRDYTVNLINTAVVPSYEDDTLPAARQYRELTDRFDPMPPKELMEGGYVLHRYNFTAFEGFLNAKLLVEILKRLGEPFDRARIRGVVEGIKDLDIGIDVPVSFGPDQHQGLNKVYFTTLEGGRFVPVTDWSRWRP